MFWVILLSIATGMRSMTPIAVVCWGAYFAWLPVEGTWAFWCAKLISVIVFTVFALGEYVGDTLPMAPKRTAIGPLGARLVFAILVGCIIATALQQPKAGGVVLGIAGALIGSFGMMRLRMRCAAWCGRDLPVALGESALALLFSVAALVHIHREIALELRHTLHLAHSL